MTTQLPLIFENLPLREIDSIKPLWEKLNALHCQDSVFFKDHYAVFTFDKRVEGIWQKPPDEVKITLVRQADQACAYCLSTADGANGEIDSLYVDEALRGQGVGRRLVEQHAAWLREKGCTKIRLAVSYGHESVLEFYHRCGFFERLTVLEYKDAHG